MLKGYWTAPSNGEEQAEDGDEDGPVAPPAKRCRTTVRKKSTIEHVATPSVITSMKVRNTEV